MVTPPRVLNPCRPGEDLEAWADEQDYRVPESIDEITSADAAGLLTDDEADQIYDRLRGDDIHSGPESAEQWVSWHDQAARPS